MIQTNCSKCGAELILHDGYGVCSKCGEIIGFDVEEEQEEIVTENFEQVESAEEIDELPTVEETAEEEIPEEVTEYETEEVFDEISDDTVVDEEKEEIEEKIEEENIASVEPEEIKIPKKKKAPIIILLVAILCVLAVLGGYFISKANQNITDTNAEDVLPKEDITEETEEPKAIDEEIEEEPTAEPVLNEEPAAEPKSAPAPAPAKTETPKKETVKKEDAVISQTPSISYRIRKSADDSETQIGAFSDLERAKAFATSHAADGYKVYDMYGNLIYQP